MKHKLVKKNYMLTPEQAVAIRKLAYVRSRATKTRISESQIIREAISDYFKAIMNA